MKNGSNKTFFALSKMYFELGARLVQTEESKILRRFPYYFSYILCDFMQSINDLLQESSLKFRRKLSQTTLYVHVTHVATANTNCPENTRSQSGMYSNLMPKVMHTYTETPAIPPYSPLLFMGTFSLPSRSYVVRSSSKVS